LKNINVYIPWSNFKGCFYYA